ncbi:MAG: adventurous gliding motility protein CglF [Pseudomonadota bacterium]
MKRFAISLFCALVLALAGATAMAQDEGAIYKKKTVINFEDDTIEGDLKTPDAEYLEARKRMRHASLIKIRDNFRRTVLQSVTNL